MLKTKEIDYENEWFSLEEVGRMTGRHPDLIRAWVSKSRKKIDDDLLWKSPRHPFRLYVAPEALVPMMRAQRRRSRKTPTP